MIRRLHTIGTAAIAEPKDRRRQRLLFGIALALWICWSFCFETHKAQGQDRSDSVKAVYLYNFGNYVEFPTKSFRTQEPEEPFAIGIVGRENTISQLLERIGEKKKIGARRIAVRRIESGKDVKHCQVVFIPAGTDLQLAADVMEHSRTQPILLVSEVSGFVGKGSPGMVNFVVQDTQIKFEICPRMIQVSGLKVSSKLIQLAVAVAE